jgi:hypothetical protein
MWLGSLSQEFIRATKSIPSHLFKGEHRDHPMPAFLSRAISAAPSPKSQITEQDLLRMCPQVRPRPPRLGIAPFQHGKRPGNLDVPPVVLRPALSTQTSSTASLAVTCSPSTTSFTLTTHHTGTPAPSIRRTTSAALRPAVYAAITASISARGGRSARSPRQ